MTTSQESIINQICQMALKTFARTTSDSNPMLHFKSTPEEFKSNLGQLKQIVNNLKYCDLGLEKSKSIIDPDNQEAPVTYINVLKHTDVSIGIFIIKSGSRIPLHNHPNMHGLLKIVYGTVDIKEYTKCKPDSVKDTEFPAFLQENPHLNLKERGFCFPADKIVCTSVKSSCDAIVLSPDENNYHEIHTVGEGPAAFFDILAPPYLPLSSLGLVDDLESSEDEPRDCNFFEEHIFKPSPSTSTNPSNPVWLRMIKCPADYESDTEPYLGPPLLL